MIEARPEPAELDRIRRLFRFFAATQARGESPVYETLSEAVAIDQNLLGLLLAAPNEQRRPSLLFAAVNLLLAGNSDELATYYPIHGGRRAVDDQLVPTFAAFCDAHRETLIGLLRERSTQINEIRRCLALRLGLDHVRRVWPGPFALVEVGASAGLNLLFDHYDYQTPGSSPVLISCEGAPVLDPPPEITTRLGIDQKPIDLADLDARAWLEAFIWPEQVAERATLRGAIGIAQANPQARVVRGDAVTDTGRILRELPGSEPIVVFTASLMSYLNADARTAFRAQLRETGRPVAWVFAEAPGLLATTGIGMPGALAQRNSSYLVGVSLPGQDRLLGLADPYLRWLAPARHPADDFHWLRRDDH